MTKVQFVKAVYYMGKENYTIETDIIPVPGEGIWFRASYLEKEDGTIDLTFVPERNIASLTIAAPPQSLEMLRDQAVARQKMQQTQEEAEVDLESYRHQTDEQR